MSSRRAARRPLAALGLLAVAAFVLSACATGTTPTTTSSTSSTTTSTSTSTTTTTLPPTGAENLFISPATLAELRVVAAAYKGVDVGEILPAEPASVYYGYVPATDTYWAMASYAPNPSDPLPVLVDFQDGGGNLLYTLPPGGSWKVIGAVGEPFCDGLLSNPVPHSILAVWDLCQPKPPPSAGPQRCTTAQLTVTIGATQGAAGTDLYPLVFTNSGTATCLLQGFPGVSFAGPSGAQVAWPATRVGSLNGPTIRVDPGSSATSEVLLHAAAGLSCPTPTTVTGLRVFPPNQYASVIVPTHQLVCTNAPKATLQVYAFGVSAQL
jgi:Protein of unknown function (DUF4232)